MCAAAAALALDAHFPVAQDAAVMRVSLYGHGAPITAIAHACGEWTDLVVTVRAWSWGRRRYVLRACRRVRTEPCVRGMPTTACAWRLAY